jgi:hypothetical protein
MTLYGTFLRFNLHVQHWFPVVLMAAAPIEWFVRISIFAWTSYCVNSKTLAQRDAIRSRTAIEQERFKNETSNLILPLLIGVVVLCLLSRSASGPPGTAEGSFVTISAPFVCLLAICIFVFFLNERDDGNHSTFGDRVRTT